jgi:hypothetical protein
MNGLPDISSISWWETATISTTALAAFLQAVSGIFSLVAYYTKQLPENHVLIRPNRKINLDRTALILAGIAAVVALAASIFSIGYAKLADRDSVEVHNQLTITYKQSSSALLDLTATREHLTAVTQQLTAVTQQLTAVTQQLADAEQQLATAKGRLQAVERESDLNLLITRMNADDAQAYDSLGMFKGTPVQNASVKAALEAVFQAHRLPYRQHHALWKHVFSDEEVENVLSSPVSRPYDRLSALEVLMTESLQLKLFPKLVSLALSDPSLDVRTAATQVLSNWTMNPFSPLDKDHLRSWWETRGKKDYAAP